MSLLEAIILGIVQGLTEFLPVSSSAHLVLVPFLMGWSLPEDQVFVFDVLVQLGTLLAVIVYFWKDLLAIITGFVRALLRGQPFGDPSARMGWYLILATIPAGLFGVLVKDQVEAAFSSPPLTAVFLFVTASLLIFSERMGKRTRGLDQINWKDALWIGTAQALSVFPGISRSGSTIAGGISRDLERPAAARFAFLMSIPIMLAAGLLAALDLAEVPNLGNFLPLIAAGFITSSVVGYLAIRWLLSYLMRHSLNAFAYYCIAIATLTLIVYALR
jgi:undecaprenyl-diphosphatase